MLKSKLLVSFVIILSFLLIIFQINENYLMADYSRALIVPTITLLYLLNKRHKSIYFTIFLIAFSISDLLTLFSYSMPFQLEYYLGNLLYIIAYISLTYEILISLSIKYILKYFKIHVVVLFILNIYANYVLLDIVKEYVTGMEFSMELFYNISTLSLLTVALLNYFYRDDKKAMIMFLGALCITFSEVMQIAYYYISEVNLLNVTYSMLLIFAFYFFYTQSKLEYEELLIIA